MLDTLSIGDLGGGINLIDIGASGEMDDRWESLSLYLNITGFEPNRKECLHLNELSSKYHSTRYLPFAISGEKGQFRLFKTKSIYCYSLLKPNFNWLRRLTPTFSSLFDIEDTEAIEAVPLSEVQELQGTDVDIIKLDTQGLELPILSNAGRLLDSAFLVETETGFVQHYFGETTFSQIDEFMRSKDFALFDMKSHRVERKARLEQFARNKAQLMWCEAIWLKDYVTLLEAGKWRPEDMSRQKFLKILLTCRELGFVDYALELAELLWKADRITPDEIKQLQATKTWEVSVKTTPLEAILMACLRLLPTRSRIMISRISEMASKERHLLKKGFY
jgi:FkbM family methyltransferase